MRRLLSKIIVTSIAGLVFICLTASAYCEEVTTINGFHIGMSIDDGLKNLERLGFKGYKIEEYANRKKNQIIKRYFIQENSGYMTFRLETDNNSREVSRIRFSGNVTRKIFNVRGISAVIFKKLFMAAYHTPEMESYGIKEGWEYTDLEQGFRVQISKDMHMEIFKTSKKSEFRFD